MNNSIDQQFVEFVVKSLVGNPDAVQVERRIDEKGVLLELTVDPEDLGRVIGKRGATAQSLRTLLRALGTKNDARYNLKIVDNGVGDHGHGASDNDDHAAPSSDSTDDATVTSADDTASASNDADDDAGHTTSSSDDLADLRDDDEIQLPAAREDNDVVSKTRRELADLDDLDV
jgi:predicted RNA-binding protein YlqC (UPF0109 family)